MSESQVKADAVKEFASSMVGALDAGFIDGNTFTVAQIYEVARNHIEDNYGIKIKTLSDVWGDDVAKLCGQSEPEEVSADTNIRSMEVKDGGLNLQLEGGACRLLAASFASQFSESGATNYLEMTFHSDETGPLVVTLQKAGAITPAGQVAKIKELIESGDLEAALAV